MRGVIFLILLVALWGLDQHLADDSERIKVDEPYKIDGDSTCYCKVCINRYKIH